jgi:hypothetical protein
MSTINMHKEMDAELTRSVRAELTAIGTDRSRLRQQQRRGRALAVSLGAAALVAATTGAAIVVSALPGTTTVAPLGTAVTATHTGTATLDLGSAPAQAGAVIIDLTCLNGRGAVGVDTIAPAGSTGSATSVDCTVRSTPVHVTDGLLPTAGSTTITITADSDTRWTATARYASSATSEWGVNANGQTYGVPNPRGVPDLTAAFATNGKLGYVVDRELTSFEGEGSINVYESDGTTVIGEFRIEIGAAVPVTPPPVPGAR